MKVTNGVWERRISSHATTPMATTHVDVTRQGTSGQDSDTCDIHDDAPRGSR